MTEAEFIEWSDLHRKLFVMRQPEDEALVLAWWPSLYSFPYVDCCAASRGIAERNPPAFRDKHLSRLLEALGGMAMKRRQVALEEQSEQSSSCPECSGTGGVIVPHIDFVHDGEWVRNGHYYPTMLVLCSCARGVGIAESQESYWQKKTGGKKVGYTLKNYELRVPHWRQLVADQKAADKKEREVEAQAARLDRRFGPLDVSKIKERLARTFKPK